MDTKKTKEGFNTILFGFAFSPTLNQNITEVTRLAHYFDAELVLLHVGAYNEQKEGEINRVIQKTEHANSCLLYTSPSPRDMRRSRMPSSA